MDCGGTVGIVSLRRLSRAGGVIAWANWCRSTVRSTPGAKGRIERAFGTLQDRMVKELRLAGVSSIAAANAWLPGFITAYNTRFGRDPANAKDLHRPLARADDLDEI